MSAKRKISIGCGLSALFGLGVIAGLVGALFMVGGLVQRTETWNSEKSWNFITNHLAGVMKLDEAQKEKLAPIVREAFEERWQIRQAYREETDRLFVEKYWPRLEEFLDEEQKERMRKRWSRWRREKILDPETGVSVGGEN